MLYTEFVTQYLLPFRDLRHLWHPERGYIVWRPGTGNNIELLHIRTFEKGKGYGRTLFYLMLDELRHAPPYHSVFGFTRVGNEEARTFYGELGFYLQVVCGLYASGEAVLFWQSYAALLEARARYEDCLRSQS